MTLPKGPSVEARSSFDADATDRIVRTKRFIGDYGLYAIFAAYFVFMALSTPRFLTEQNIVNVVRQSSIVGLVAIGLTPVMITAGIDLSVGAVVGFSGIVAASFSQPDGSGLVVPLVAGLIVGVVVGLINSGLIIRGAILPFLATLAVMAATRGAALIFSNGQPIGGLNSTFDWLGQSSIGPIPVPIVIFVSAAVLMDVVLSRTAFGKHVYAVGGDIETARSVGIRVPRILLRVYVLAAVLAALAGVVLTARVDGADPLAGTGYELDAIAAVVIGGTSLFGGRGSIRGTIVGVLLLAMVVNGLNLLNVPSYYQQIIKGAVLVLAVLLGRWRSD